jgi:hypothetical protein
MSGNLASTLRRSRRGNPMRRFDRAPAALRALLAKAALPWSVDSAMKLYARALKAACGDQRAALAVLSDRERALIARDAAKVWGPTHPAAAPREAQAT